MTSRKNFKFKPTCRRKKVMVVVSDIDKKYIPFDYFPGDDNNIIIKDEDGFSGSTYWITLVEYNEKN
ncbi:MAG: hypothetical protein ACK5HS_01745 [Mycoplasmatales bacterium]